MQTTIDVAGNHDTQPTTGPDGGLHPGWQVPVQMAHPGWRLDTHLRVLGPAVPVLAHWTQTLWIDRGCLRLALPSAQRRLEKLVRETCLPGVSSRRFVSCGPPGSPGSPAPMASRGPADSAGPRAMALARGSRRPLVLIVQPAEDPVGGARHALLHLRDPDAIAVDPGLLRDLFELTPMEAAVVAAIADGRSAEQVAAAHGVQRETVNAQLKKALAKTGTNRQAALVALVLRCAARPTTPPEWTLTPHRGDAARPNLDHLGNAEQRAA